MSIMGEKFSPVASDIATIMLIWSMCRQLIPDFLKAFVSRLFDRVMAYFYPDMEITFYEYQGHRFKRSDAYTSIETYLGSISTGQVKRLKGDILKKSQSISFSMDESESVADVFQGVQVKWLSGKTIPNKKTISFYPLHDEKRFYVLNFDRRDRKIVTGEYLKHVMQEGKEIAVRNRQRKLYTNTAGEEDSWSHVAFEHPATFQTLAMDPKKKEEIINDLITFSKSKDHYAKVGKAWKRGYLLYGPPGTGKSTMIAAIANLLNYDVYDLELTAVEDNTELRRLLIDTSSKLIIVIEDIDCSLDLTAERKKNNTTKNKGGHHPPVGGGKKEKDEGSKVTLSGLLNFVDGLWSTSVAGERIIIFTTNHLEKLDPALIRIGRMDKHIEMSYCDFESFKALARNYLDVHSHKLFDKIGKLLGEVNITPADVAENLTPKSAEEGVDSCLESLVQALEIAKKKNEKEAAAAAAKNEEGEAKLKDSKKEVRKSSPGQRPNIIKGKKVPAPLKENIRTNK